MNLLLLLSIGKSIPSMEDTHVVGILNVTFLEIQIDGKLFAEIMKSIECFRLCLGNWWNLFTSGKSTVTDKVSTSILYS